IGKKSNKIKPFYKNFRGDIIETNNGYITVGKWDIVNATTIRITELPIGFWTQKFIDMLHKLIEDKFIKDFVNHSTTEFVDITIYVHRENMVKLSNDINIIDKFKLETRLYTSNMNLYV